MRRKAQEALVVFITQTEDTFSSSNSELTSCENSVASNSSLQNGGSSVMAARQPVALKEGVRSSPTASTINTLIPTNYKNSKQLEVIR